MTTKLLLHAIIKMEYKSCISKLVNKQGIAYNMNILMSLQ